MSCYRLANMTLDSVELKCLVVSKGVKVDPEIYRRFSGKYRLGINPLMCNCMILPDGTIVQMTDVGFHIQYLTGILSWDNLKLLKYASDLKTPFSVSVFEDKPSLFYEKEFICPVGFPPKTDFYFRKTTGGLPFLGNSVIQGVDWVAFQCLWPCEYAYAGKPCEFCFSGADFEACAKKKRPLPQAAKASDVAEIVEYAINSAGCNSVQITGGSTFDNAKESALITSYLEAIDVKVGRGVIKGDVLLYITPPKDPGTVDRYFELGASKIAFSIEVWDEKRAEIITPGKMEFTTRKRHLDAMEYVASKFGAGRAFSNFIIGIEPFETLRQGATYLAERGIIPTASIWMPMGRPVMGSMQTPDIDYYRRVIELFASLYQRYHLEPSACCGLNVCMERDIWKYSLGMQAGR